MNSLHSSRGNGCRTPGPGRRVCEFFYSHLDVGPARRRSEAPHASGVVATILEKASFHEVAVGQPVGDQRRSWWSTLAALVADRAGWHRQHQESQRSESQARQITQGGQRND